MVRIPRRDRLVQPVGNGVASTSALTAAIGGRAPAVHAGRAWPTTLPRGTMALMTIKRTMPDLATEDIATATAFYVEVLGFEVVMDMGWIVTLSDRTNPKAQLSLMTHDATAPVIPDVSVEVDDVDAAHQAARNAGAEIVHPLTDEPWGVRRFFMRDPNGKVINVLTHKS
ncbi:VOC family protein [Micromonospora sp. MH33]|uniref:VOC family protein n=1 Tax=Micromonospora sp. MH33 TaxID=1945509 RepID=UPI001FEF96B9|nr:VOC family protein [Micromonospora sp. MH33]